ncbi:thiamine-monophosphate kinase [Rhodothermaceae bacterium RA]|nr:thiamine-monophosphate kinase [Rhodothermaceae bacterium RA]
MASFTPVSDIGEFGLIDRIRAIVGEPERDDLLAGIGDDAAVYQIGGGRVHVVTTDALIETVHFDRSFMPMEYLGFKAMSVNVSDVVAMNAMPRYATIVLGLPSNVSVEMVEAFYRGAQRAAARYGTVILGGDTTAARWLTVSVTVIGEAEEDAVVYRGGAQPGDLLCVTGDLGAAYAGLKVLLHQQQRLREHDADAALDLSAHRYVIQRQLTPTARLDVVQDWAARGVQPTALIDISDGLASEVHHLCRTSHCGAHLYGARIPIDLETRQVADDFAEEVDTYALFGGEDYELLFALPEEHLDRMNPETFTVIGRFTDPDEGVRVQDPTGEIISLEAAGYQHFGTARSDEEAP